MLEYVIIPFFFLLIFMCFGYGVLGFFLIVRSFQIHHNNLFWLGIGFISVSIGLIGNILLEYGRYFQIYFINIKFFLIAVFVYQTFHRKKKNSKAKLILSSIFIILLSKLIYFLFSFGWAGLHQKIIKN